jgi:hypothetical protein
MGSFCKSPTPPPAPDPTVVANAQSASNIATAQEQQRLNMVGQTGPTGTSTGKPTIQLAGRLSAGHDAIAGPAGHLRQRQPGPDRRARRRQPADRPRRGCARQGPELADPADQLRPGRPRSRRPTTWAATSASRFNQGQSDPGRHRPAGPDGRLQNAADASYGQAASRLDPQWETGPAPGADPAGQPGAERELRRLQDRDGHLQPREERRLQPGQLLGAEPGPDAENTLFGQSAQQGQFHNAAANQLHANQGYSQNLGAAQFANQAQAQQDQQNQQAAQFGNTAAAQQYAQNQGAAQFGNQALGQQFQQDAYSQNLPINEFNALMSSGQVGMPQGFGYSASSVNPTDVLGAYALNSQGANQGYQAQMRTRTPCSAAWRSSAAPRSRPAFSDIRLKRDIELIGREDDGLGVYRYRYLWDDEPRTSASWPRRRRCCGPMPSSRRPAASSPSTTRGCRWRFRPRRRRTRATSAPRQPRAPPARPRHRAVRAQQGQQGAVGRPAPAGRGPVPRRQEGPAPLAGRSRRHEQGGLGRLCADRCPRRQHAAERADAGRQVLRPHRPR